MKSRLLALLPFLLALPASAESLYFELATPEDTTRIVLVIEGSEVVGEQYVVIADAHGTQGSLKGKVAEDGLLHLRHDYTIEGSDQSEEVVYKLEGDQLLLGSGELVEGEGGLLKLKDPAKVEFSKALPRVKVGEPKPGSPERKEIMDAMRGPISAYVGKAVQFTGEVRAYGGWALFSGNVATIDGKPPGNADAAFQLDLDFLSLLKMDPEGRWQMLFWGFSGDIGARDEALERFPEVPWVVLR